MTQVETQPQPPEMVGWIATVRAFLQVPSCLATVTLGSALFLEWICHGKNHTGFEWIIYYALFLVTLPIVIVIGLHVLMAISSSSSQGSNQIVESPASKEAPRVVENQSTETTTQRTEETEKINSCQSLAVVVAADDKEMPRIKRAVSFPSHGVVRSCRTR